MTPLAVSLTELVRHIPPNRNDWWIIGSAAVALSGAPVEPEDVDLFASSDTVTAILNHLGLTAAPPKGSAQFRSFPYHTVDVPGGLPIDLMGDMEVCRDGVWTPFRVETRVPVTYDGITVFVPEVAEQICILDYFGRPKDLIRAALLRQHSKRDA